MSGLRRRIFGTSGDETPSPVPSRAPSPAPATRSQSTKDKASTSANAEDDQLVSIPFRKLERLNSYVTESQEKAKTRTKGKGRKRRHAWVFALGGMFGLLLAGFFASSADVIDFGHLADMNLDSLVDVLPAGLIRDARELQVRLSLLSAVYCVTHSTTNRLICRRRLTQSRPA